MVIFHVLGLLPHVEYIHKRFGIYTTIHVTTYSSNLGLILVYPSQILETQNSQSQFQL